MAFTPTIKAGIKMEIKMIARIHSKPETQGMIKALRDAGYTVEKINGGYVCNVAGLTKPITIFKAMNGTRGYLCRYAENLFD
jgi:hypothetical protein